ncbi:MAG: hypothetical protein GAK43_02218 [Stenotrophomonas maltophilia]|nr:MAG: hypothetical protein GAK43_02218 [Stenotrophomonas maltophilia]
MTFRAPSHLSNPLRRFARRLVPEGQPLVVEALPLPESMPDEPWFSSGRAAQSLGGERVDGWSLEEWPGLALRARFAACWRDPRGQFWNVLPEGRPPGFLPDPRRRFAGVPIPDQYHALSRDALLEDYLTLCQAAARADLDEPRGELLAGLRQRLEDWLAHGGRADQPCPCGSGRRYRNCCSRRVREA